MHRGKTHRRRTARRLGGRKKTARRHKTPLGRRHRKSMRGGYGSATAISPFNVANPQVYKPETLPDPQPVPGVPMPGST